jgi:hypothetical protein
MQSQGSKLAAEAVRAFAVPNGDTIRAMRLPILALGVIVLAAATSVAAPMPSRPGAASPAPRAASDTPAPTPARAPAGHKNLKKSFDAEARAVTWTYSKLHHPQLVAAVLRDVQAGKLPRSAVETLASPATLDRLLDAKLPQRTPVTRGPTLGPAPRGETKKQSSAVAASEWGALTVALPVQPDYSPKQLALPDAYDKEVKRASVWFTANADGHVTATLPTGAPFRIKRITSYDGSYERTPLGMIMSAWDWRDTAPFALSVRAGQQYAVTVEFAPEFELGTMMAGQKNGKLRVKGDKFTVNVPLSAMFRGIHVAGVVLSPTEDLVTVDAYLPATKKSITTKMQVFNLGTEARTATISADSLPPGMTLVGSPSVSLAVGETKNVDVTLQLDGGEYGYGQPAVLRATAPGGLTSSAALTMNIVKTERVWEFKDDAEGIDFWLVYRLSSEGHWWFMGTEHNTGSPLGWNLDIQLKLGGIGQGFPIHASPGTMTGIGGPQLVSQHTAWDSAGPNGGAWTKNFYAELIAKSAKFVIEMDSVP